MVAVVLLVMVSASMVLGDPINETCTVTTGPFGKQTKTCRRIGEVISNGGRTVKRVNTTHTVVSGPGQSVQLDIPSNLEEVNTKTRPSESITDQHDRLISEINRLQDELNRKVTYLQDIINANRNARNKSVNDPKTQQSYSENHGSQPGHRIQNSHQPTNSQYDDSHIIDGGLTLNDNGLYFQPAKKNSKVPSVSY